MSKLTDTIRSFFEELSSKPKVGGLQITDSSLQYVLIEGGKVTQDVSLRLPPGVVQGGKIQDKAQLTTVLQQLHTYVVPENKKDRVRVVVCLPSAITYTQNFNIPNIGAERLEESVDLNLQTISPIPVQNASMSWQLIGETEDKYEVLGAFAEKDVVDQFKEVLHAANFYPVVFEFPSLSLLWLMNAVVGPREQSILTLHVSSDGIDLFVVKNGAIYFDYFRSWRSIQGDAQQISRSLFDEVIVEEVRKVMNFTTSRFGEGLQHVLLVTPGFEKEVEEVLEKNFGIQAAPLAAEQFNNLPSSWFAALGSAIRGSWERSEDRFISIGTDKVERVFYQEQVISFTRLWRTILMSTLIIFQLIYVGSWLLLRSQPAALSDRLNQFNVQTQTQELALLQETAEEFNGLTQVISGVRGESDLVFSFLTSLRSVADEYRVTLTRVDLPSINGLINMTARAASYDTVINFKNALQAHDRFTNVDLPLSRIVPTEENYVIFEVSFEYQQEVPGVTE